MKFFQNSLRALVVIGSLGGFLSGWAWFAHTNKPVSASTTTTEPVVSAPAPLPTLAPLNFSNPGSVQQLQPLPQIPQFSAMPMTRLRTRGS